MFEKIEIFDKRYSELSERLYQPSVARNPEEYQKIMKEIKSIEEIVLTYRKYKEAVQTEKDSLEILEETSDKELNGMLLLKSVAVQAARNRLCSVRFCSECTRCMPKKRASKSRLSMPMKPKSAVTRKFPL